MISLYKRVKRNHADAMVLVEYVGKYYTFGEDEETLRRILPPDTQDGMAYIKKGDLCTLTKLGAPYVVVGYGRDNRGGSRAGSGRKRKEPDGSRYVGFLCPPELLEALGDGNKSKRIVEILRKALL